MKKQPRPTVTRMTRVWCPGRPRPMTAWRSGNQRTRDSGCTSRTKAAPAPTRAIATTTKPPETNAPTRNEPACQAASPANSSSTTTVAIACTGSSRAHSRRAGVAPVPSVSSRSSDSGLTRWMPASGTSALPTETSVPSTRACSAAGQRQPEARVAERDDGVRRHRRQAQPGDQQAERAAGEAEDQRLQHVDGEDPPARRAQALERGDAGALLLQEHARDAPHADAAEHEDHVADQAEEVLRALDLRPHARLGVVVRADRREAVAQARAQALDDRLERRVGHLQQALVAGPAAEADQAGRRRGRRGR